MYQISWCVPFTVVAIGPKQMKECIITSSQESWQDTQEVHRIRDKEETGEKK